MVSIEEQKLDFFFLFCCWGGGGCGHINFSAGNVADSFLFHSLVIIFFNVSMVCVIHWEEKKNK